MNAPVLCIFARVPAPGRVKSRLAAEIGAEAAVAAHCTLVEDTLHRLAGMAGVITELWLDDPDHAAGRAWGARWGLAVRGQQGRDLGARMQFALASAVARSGAGVVVGTDCPPVDAGYVRQALTALDDHDIVLGPAADGGYGLIAGRCPAPELFEGIRWGTSSVLRQTLEAAADAGYRVARLPQIWDVDTAADWQRFLDRPPR